MRPKTTPPTLAARLRAIADQHDGSQNSGGPVLHYARTLDDGTEETSKINTADLYEAADALEPRTITTLAELNALPHETVIRLPRFNYTLEKLDNGWHRAGIEHAYQANAGWLPATVLFAP